MGNVGSGQADAKEEREQRGERISPTKKRSSDSSSKRESEREAKVFGGGGAGRDCGVRAAATTASKSGRR